MQVFLTQPLPYSEAMVTMEQLTKFMDALRDTEVWATDWINDSDALETDRAAGKTSRESAARSAVRNRRADEDELVRGIRERADTE